MHQDKKTTSFRAADIHTYRERARAHCPYMFKVPPIPKPQPLSPHSHRKGTANLGTFGVQDNLSTNVEGCSRSFVRCRSPEQHLLGAEKNPPKSGTILPKLAYLAALRAGNKRTKENKRKRKERWEKKIVYFALFTQGVKLGQ